MIKVSYIAPTSLIPEYGDKSDFHLTLAHLLDDTENDYERAIKESGLPIYLDNGLFENGESVPLSDLMEKAARLKARYVFAPDVLYSRKETEENVGEAYEELKRVNEKYGTEVELAAVVQADNKEDYLESYRTMVQDERISLIGLSILSIPKSYQEVIGFSNISMSRLLCLRDLSEFSEHKDCHLLGAGSSYVDVFYANLNCPFVKSHDSSSAIWNGVQGHIFKADGDLDKGKTRVHVDFDFNTPLSGGQKYAIEWNQRIVHQACKGELSLFY